MILKTKQVHMFEKKGFAEEGKKIREKVKKGKILQENDLKIK